MSAENDSKASTKNESQPIKIVLVGDGAVGKTCLLLTYTSGNYPSEYTPTVFDGHGSCFREEGNDYDIDIWDTAGQEDYDRLRPLSYPQSNVFLVCFSVTNRPSFVNVSEKWLPEVRHHCGLGVPTVLVGTKSDLRKDDRTQKELQEQNSSFVSTEEAIALAESEEMFAYIECSALTSAGIHYVIKAAVEAGRNYEAPPKKKPCCPIL